MGRIERVGLGITATHFGAAVADDSPTQHGVAGPEVMPLEILAKGWLAITAADRGTRIAGLARGIGQADVRCITDHAGAAFESGLATGACFQWEPELRSSECESLACGSRVRSGDA